MRRAGPTGGAAQPSQKHIPPQMLYQATRNFASSLQDGTGVVVREGEFFDPDNAIVREFPDYFRARPDLSRPEIEDATADPGRRRQR